MCPRIRDIVELVAELPYGIGPRIDRDLIPEERVVIGHLLPAVAEDAPFPRRSGSLSCASVHNRNSSTEAVERAAELAEVANRDAKSPVQPSGRFEDPTQPSWPYRTRLRRPHPEPVAR
jgi:hypothetical protein